MNKNRYLEKVYGGLLGKCAGVRLGAPVEPSIWTYERIQEVYGEIHTYVKNYKNFAADDDINGPLFFIRSLIDHKEPLTAEKIGETWLNYTREGIGFFWWGGKGRSTEHTAYLNLKNGIPAPRSGSAEVNGITVAEQIGGQIFIDTWGLVFPDSPVEASKYAKMAASVSHDRNGLYGAAFIAALISLAFSITDINLIIEKALQFIPAASEYSKVVKAVHDFHMSNPDSWRSARDFLNGNFGYDKYPGVCHIVPNSGIVALALYYGEGDFAKTIEIATMCGWDTDCNAGNAGTILGVMNGPDSIPDHYIKPMHDFHAASSISGSLNIIDIPTAAREIAIIGLKNMKEDIPQLWKRGAFSNDIHLDFALSGSTCGIRTSKPYLTPVIRNSGNSGLLILLDRFKQYESVRLFYKPYYKEEDFDDKRYSPTFTPLVYSGQILNITGELIKWDGNEITIKPYVRDSLTKEIFTGKELSYSADNEIKIRWQIPAVPFAIDEIGLIVTQNSEGRFFGELFVYQLNVVGNIQFTVDFKDEKKEFDGLSRCSLTGGKWELHEDALHANLDSNAGNYFLLYSGPYYSKDYKAETELIPVSGNSHLLIFRSIGAERGYFFGFQEENSAVLLKKDHKIKILKKAKYKWAKGKKYNISADILGKQIRCFINGKEIISFYDEETFPYGMAGVGKLLPGKTIFRTLKFSEKKGN